MSDATITPEERAQWRKRLSAPFLDSSKKPFSLRALDALEIEEKRAADLRALLGASCEKTRANFSDFYRMATEIVPELNKRLEAAEKALLKEEVYSEELESQLQDAESEYNANWAVQAISDVARLVGVYEQCSETGDDIGAAVIEAVQDLKAENARLTAERDWLVSWFDAHPCCMDLHCPFGRSLEQCEAREGGMLDSTECWLEAARRVVAGEGEVGK